MSEPERGSVVDGQNRAQPCLTREVLRKIHLVYFVLLALTLATVALIEILA